MNNVELDHRIQACAAMVRSVIVDLQDAQPTVEQAVAMGALLACLSTLDVLTASDGESNMSEVLNDLVGRGLLEVVPEEDAS